MRMRDWSSDVCSSDLAAARLPLCAGALREAHGAGEQDAALRYGSRDCGAAIRIIRQGKRKRRLGPDLDCNIGGAISSRTGQIALHAGAPLRRLPFQCLRADATNHPATEDVVTRRWACLTTHCHNKTEPTEGTDKQTTS